MWSLKSWHLIDEFLDAIEITIDIKHKNKINILDLTLFHKKDKIKSMWHTKETWSFKYLHFNSNNPICLKKTGIIGLIDLALKLSDPEYREEGIQKVKNALKINNYPETLINTTFKKRIHKFDKESTKQSQQETIKKQYLSLPLFLIYWKN